MTRLVYFVKETNISHREAYVFTLYNSSRFLTDQHHLFSLTGPLIWGRITETILDHLLLPDSMNIEPGHIGFDIDCVVADTMEAFIRLALEDYDITVRPDEITNFFVEECLDIDRDIVDEIFGRLLANPLEVELKPMAGAVSVLERLAEKAPLSFITARPDIEPVASWLEFHLCQNTCRNACLISSGDHDSKAAYIKKLGLQYFVDDRHETCNMLASEKNITPIVFSQPWNRDKHALDSVDDWLAIDKLCS